MFSPRTTRFLCTCVLAATPCLTATAQSPDTGIVRISDRGPKTVQPATHTTAGQYHAMSGDVVYGHDHGMGCPCPHCQGKKGWKGGKFCDHYCSHSPDHGYSIPGKWPIQRRGVQYNSYYPAAWHGTEGALAGGVTYPMVYQPTDTTQLGFYYQHVPFWQPQPNPLPPRPIPPQWHIYAPVAYASQFEHGFTTHGGMVVYESTATGTPTLIEQPAPQPAPRETLPPAPPAPLQESAVPQPIERIGY